MSIALLCTAAVAALVVQQPVVSSRRSPAVMSADRTFAPSEAKGGTSVDTKKTAVLFIEYQNEVGVCLPQAGSDTPAHLASSRLLAVHDGGRQAPRRRQGMHGRDRHARKELGTREQGAQALYAAPRPSARPLLRPLPRGWRGSPS